MLNLPARDLSAFLSNHADEHAWSPALFTERSFEEALARADRFDCLILGYNAIHRSPALRDALAASFPDTGVLVLHQIDARAFECLRDDLALKARALPGRVREIVPPRDVRADLEVLLRWPRTVGDGAWQSVQGLDAPADGAWRIVLEADTGGRRRVPVLVRTHAWRHPRVAVCTVLLEPARAEHANLLANLISFCARGLPEVVMFPEPPLEPWELLRHKLALGDTHAVEIRERSADYDGWPEVGAGTVVVGRADERAAGWQELGGRLVTMDGGRLSGREGSSDLRWIARRWSAALATHPEAEWLGGWLDGRMQRGSILATRAVLRTTALLAQPAYAQATAGVRPGLGVPNPDHPELKRRVRELLQRRRIDLGHIEQTVSTTAAALDVDELAGRVLRGPVRERAERWLRERFDAAAVEDKFDIARRLADRRLFERAVEELEPEPSPLLLARLWHAAVDCGLPLPETIALTGAGAHELRESSLVAGSYLAALARHREATGKPPLAATSAAVEDALRTLRRSGTLLSRRAEHWGSAESVSTEALALLMLFRHPARLLAHVPEDGRPDAQVARPREPLAPVLTEGLLAETALLRVRNARLERNEHTLRVAANVCAVSAMLAGAVVLIAVGTAPRTVADWFALAGLAILIVLAAFAVLQRWELLPAWAAAIARLVGEGVGGLPRRLRELTERTRDT